MKNRSRQYIKQNPQVKNWLKIVAAAVICWSCSAGTTYYVDALNGSDTSSGKGPDKAWKSLAKVNEQLFQPGDRILFKAGTEYEGQLEPKGNGSEKAPIVIDIYGGDKKPVLHGKGVKQHTLLLANAEYWEVNNLEITNQGEQPDPGRNGVIIWARDTGDRHHIHLKNLTVHDVNGSLVKNEGGGNGIFWTNGGKIKPTRFVDLLIENCHVYRCQRNGITGSGNSGRDHWYPSLKVVIRGNLIEEVPGDGIVPIACDGALVEHNVVRNSPDVLRIEDAAAGIWPWSCDNTVIQFNEVSGQKAKWDAQGFDSDYNCRNSLFQYNYSHDNYGGFVMVCCEGNTLGQPYNIGTENTVIRYNVSVNDGLRPYKTRGDKWFSPLIHISGPSKNTRIYNNIIYIERRPDPEMDHRVLVVDNWGGPWPEDLVFMNNVFYVWEDDSEYRFELGEGIRTRFLNNLYYGNFPDRPEDVGAVTADPQFLNRFPSHLKAKVMEALKLKSSSPCRGKGMLVPDPGERDFWGNAIVAEGPVNIGAYQGE